MTRTIQPLGAKAWTAATAVRRKPRLAALTVLVGAALGLLRAPGWVVEPAALALGLASFLLLLGLVVVVPLVALSGLACLVTLTRPVSRTFGLTAAFGLGYCALWLGTMHYQDSLHRASVVRRVERAAPVVDALQRYEREHGQPAAELAQLVPRYLPAVPMSGWLGDNPYSYDRRRTGKGWVLSFSATTGIPTIFDACFYGSGGTSTSSDDPRWPGRGWSYVRD